jgi:L-ascorbate 6-phosphate lactonase
MNYFTLEDVRSYPVPHGALALWWLGQAGFIVKSADGAIIALDPYLTNSCEPFGAQVGLDMKRLVPPPLLPQGLAGIDAYVLTHSHRDHLDPETLAGYAEADGSGPYIAPPETCEKLESLGVANEGIKMVWPNKEYSVGDITIRATFAIPFGGDDLTHVGYLMRVVGGATVYFTGDTAYHEILHRSVREHGPDVMVSVINPAYRNLSPLEAARLARELDVQIVIPCHYDMFADNCQPPQMLRTNLIIEGIGERYRELKHGVPFVFPE